MRLWRSTGILDDGMGAERYAGGTGDASNGGKSLAAGGSWVVSPERRGREKG